MIYRIDILMVTYNHEFFIKNAIESVLMQVTSFNYRLIIGEDYSSDNTRKICQEYAFKYPKKIKLILNEKNLGIAQNYKRLFDISDSKYIAILEGDDYWIDKNKLQKQYEILEKYNNVGLVYTKYLIKEDGIIKPFIFPSCSNLNGKIYNDLFSCNFIGPLTTCFRKSLFDKYFDFNYILDNNLKTVDYLIWLELSYHSNFYFIDSETAVYNKHPDSVSNSKNFEKIEQFSKSIISILEYFKYKYNINQNKLTKVKNNLYHDLMLKAIYFGKFKKALFYNALCYPIGIISAVRILCGKSVFTIKLGICFKFFKIYR